MGGAVGFSSINTLTEDPLSTSVTQSLVTDRFALSQDYANTTFNTALNYLGQFEDISVSFDWTPPAAMEINSPSGLSGLSPVLPEAVQLNEIAISPIDFLAQIPQFEDHNIISIDIPEFNVATPNFFIPDAPTTLVPTFTDDAPIAATINLPSSEDIPDIPPLPVLQEILLPDEPEFNLPSFDAVMPVADLTPPDLLFSWNEAEYSSDVLNALRNKIIDGILNGGQGMLPEVEQAIYDRASTKIDIEAQKNELLALSDFSSKGSRLPQGALVARLNEIRLQNIMVRGDLTNDIMIKSADLAYQYSTFIIDKGISLEHELMTLFNSTQQRAFEAAKVLIEFAVQMYDVRVKAFTARLEGYKTEAEIFKARIQAEIARAELYKYVIEGRKLSVEMQSLLVDLYGKQIGAIETMAKIYSIKMDGAKIQADIDRIGLERFRELVNVYRAKIEGVTAEYNLYQAQIAGEAEKAKMYSYQIEGYKSLVDASKVKSDVDINILRAKIEKGQGEINIFTVLIDKYKADLQGQITEAEIQAKAEGLKVQVFDSEVKRFSSVVAALVDVYKADTSVGIANAEIQSKYGEMLARIESAEAEIKSELIKAKALVASQLSSAALSSVSAGANLGYSQSRSDGTGTNYNRSDSNSNNFTEIYSHD